MYLKSKKGNVVINGVIDPGCTSCDNGCKFSCFGCYGTCEGSCFEECYTTCSGTSK